MSSQYALNGLCSKSVAADLKQLEAVKVGPPGSNFDPFAFWLAVQSKYKYRATALACTSPKAKVLAQITYKYVNRHINRQKGQNMTLAGKL